MLYTVFISKSWGNKKRIRGISIQERDDASIASVTVFAGYLFDLGICDGCQIKQGEF